jgi:hypothetical protein
MPTDTGPTWFPLFELQDWVYQSVLVLPTSEENAAAPGAGVTAKKWAKGSLFLGQAFEAPGEGYDLPGGRLEFASGLELEVSAKGTKGSGSTPASFEGTGVGTVGPLKGAIYQLTGWVFAEQPIAEAAGKVLSVHGSVRAVRGPDANPTIEPGGMPAGTTVGSFVVSRAELT